MSGKLFSRRSFAFGGLAAIALAVVPAASTSQGPADAVRASEADLRRPGPYKLYRSRLVRTDGYGSATLFWPKKPAARCPIVVTFPGYTGPEEEMHTIAKRLATHGFAVLAAGALEGHELPDQRGEMMLNAMREAKRRREWADVVDADRTAFVGYSMGGGGALYAAEKAKVSAVVALNPWSQRGYPKVSAPTLIVGGSYDKVAPMTKHARPIFNSLKNAKERAVLTRIAGDHKAGVKDDPLVLSRITAFLKLHAAGDESVRQLYQAPAEPLTRWSIRRR